MREGREGSAIDELLALEVNRNFGAAQELLREARALGSLRPALGSGLDPQSKTVVALTAYKEVRSET
jgi:hypothetical protein